MQHPDKKNVSPGGGGHAAGAGASGASASVNLSCCYGEQTCHAASVNLSCCYFRGCKIVGVLGDPANFIGGAGRDAGAGAALHDRMVYQRRKVQALVIVTDLVCSIVLCNEFVSMFGSQVEFLALLLMISCVRIWFPVALDWRWCIWMRSR